MAKANNPNKKPPCSGQVFEPPGAMVRPRNGVIGGDALGTEKLSGHDGGGKSRKPFVPIADRPNCGPAACSFAAGDSLHVTACYRREWGSTLSFIPTWTVPVMFQ